MTEIRLENDLVLVRPIEMEDAKALAEVATDELYLGAYCVYVIN